MNLKSFLKFLKLNENNISMVFGAVLVLIVGIFGYNYYRSQQGQATPTAASTQLQVTPAPQEGKIPESLPNKVTVVSGETLWSIAEAHYGSGYNWTDIATANSLTNPELIAVGQELTLPQIEAKKATTAAASGLAGGTTPTTPTTTSIPTEAPSAFPTIIPSLTPPTAMTTPTAIQGENYTVVRGDNLWNIAVRAYGDGYQWVKIWHANKATIANHPDLIFVSQALTIPRADTK